MTLKRLQEETHSPTRLGRRLAGQGSQQSILRPGADPLQAGRGLFPYVKIVAVKVGDEPMNLISLRLGGRFQAPSSRNSTARRDADKAQRAS